jgi:hypothetical protein
VSVRQALISFSGPFALAVLLPVMVLAVGLPVAFLVRAVLELARWLLGAIG